MRLAILLSLAALAAANSALTAENFYGYDFHPKPQTYHAAAPFTRGLIPKLKSWADRFPTIKSLINSKTSTLPVELQRVTNNGYTHYSQSAAMQAVEGVEAENFDPFVSYLADSLGIGSGKRDSFVGSMELIKFADNSDWSLFDIIFSENDGANCYYVCVLGHRDLENDRYDFMIADFETSFQLAPDIVIIEERKSYLWGLVQRGNIHAERIPASLKLQDVELLKTFFSQAALSRFAKMLDIRVPEYEDATFVDPLTVISVISAGLDIFQKVINIFKTTSTSTIIKEVAGEGFSHYEQSAKAQVIQGITEHNVRSKLIPILPRMLQLNNEVFEGVKDAVEIGLLAESYTWNDFKIAFSQDKSAANTVQFVDVVCANRGDEKFNLILVNVAQAFKLAPNVQYIENSKSYVGGIYSETKIERREYPRSLTDKDLEVLMGFFHITVFKRLAAQYNVKVPQIPDKPPLKN